MTQQQYSDRARRLSEAVTLAMLDDRRDKVGYWMAARLSDGRSDGNLYDTKGDAIRHQLVKEQCAYVCLTADGMSPRAAENFLKFTEGLYSVGADLADPDTQVQMPREKEHIPGLLQAIARRR